VAIVMVPTGWHRRSQEDWHSTVGTPVQFNKYAQLTDDQLRWLRYAFPSGRACIWATSKYNDWPQPRDHVWFHQDNYVIGIGEVHASFENPDLAGALWREGIEIWQKGLPETPTGWRYIFAFTEPQAAMISKRVIGPLVGHKANDRWQGTRRLTEAQSATLQARLVWTIGRTL
jgi:hypothetical protein